MLNKSIFNKWSFIFVALLSLVLIFYTNYRAATLSITHDEGVIYELILWHSPADIFNYIIPEDHMLNSLLMRYSCQFFPDTAYALRLPNLIGHLLFIIFSILLLSKIKNQHLFLAGFIMLNVNPYLLDFFSLGRGYGLSASFMMVSLFYGFSFIQSNKKKPLILAFVFAILSVLTVYTLINYFFALIGVIAVFIFVSWAENKFRPERKKVSVTLIFLGTVVISGLILFWKLYGPLQLVQSSDFIYQQHHANLYSGTIRSLVYCSNYKYDGVTTVNIFSNAIIIMYLLSFLLMFYLGLRKDFSFSRRLLFYSFIISIIIAASISLQYELFRVRFLINRASTFLIPVIILTFIGFIDELIRLRRLKISSLILIYFVAGLFLINMIQHGNLKWYLDWKYDASTRDMMTDLCRDHDKSLQKPVKMGIEWLFEPSINFYRKTWHLKWMEPVDRNGYDGKFDYYYVTDADTILSKNIFKDRTIIKRYDNSNTVLLK